MQKSFALLIPECLEDRWIVDRAERDDGVRRKGIGQVRGVAGDGSAVVGVVIRNRFCVVR